MPKANQTLNLEEMLNAGMHLGHKKERSHASAKSFIFGVKEGISIINLEKTQDSLIEAKQSFNKLIKEGKNILFVGTKGSAKVFIQKTAEKLEAPYINEKWLGGTLTNFETIQNTLQKMKQIEDFFSGEKVNTVTKRERTKLKNKLEKMRKIFSGISSLKQLPDVLFIVDPAEEKIALQEAKKINIPVMAICDTNSNPNFIDYPIFANDDAKTSLKMIFEYLFEIDFDKEQKNQKEEDGDKC